MNIGSLRHRISLYYFYQTEETGGPGTYDNMTLIADLWAKIESLTGLMRFDTKQISDGVTHKITIRYYKNLSSQNWMKYVDPTMGKVRNFQIMDIRNLDERNQYLELLVKEVGVDDDDFEAGSGSAGQPVEG